MHEDYKKYLPLLIRLFTIALIILGIYLFATTFLVYLLPFILGWIIATILEPLIRFLNLKWKLSRAFSTLISIFIFVLFTSLVITLIGGIVVLQLTKLSNMLPQYSNLLYQQSFYLVKVIQDLFIQLPADLSQSIINLLHSISDKLTSILAVLVASLLNFLTAIPAFFLFVVVTILSAYFIARDKRKILRFIVAQVPSKTISKGKVLKHDLIVALVGYIKAQLILMSITFVESAIGLTLIGIDYSVLLALLASIIDAFPILGTGTIYVPLILWKVFTGHYQTALALGALYGLIIFVRQMLEPKILGSQIGLYPLVTLMSMYIGLKLFGVFGLIIGPVFAIILMSLQKIDLLPKWKK